ncbi:MAG: hypothetical protein OIF48_19850 [Silicimonas sp.]|nr:hypothetical protein [Silicimonas sp.]
MDEVEEFLRARAETLGEGNLQALAADCVFPMPIFIDGEVEVIRSVEHMIRRIEHCRDELESMGYRRASFEVTSSRYMKPERARVEGVWGFRDNLGQVLTWLELGYFVDKGADGTWRISMIECVAKPETRRISA